MKRFYTLVSYGQENDGYPILLDGKTAKTPSGNLLTAPNAKVVDAMMREWNEQTDNIDPQSMPITQIQITKLDFIDGREEEAVAQILKYIDTDLLFYRADHPLELSQKQAALWDRWLDWMTDEFKLNFETTTGLQVVKQDSLVHDTLKGYVRELDSSKLVIYYILTNLCKSVILPLAFFEQEAKPQEIFESVQVEEIYKQNFYNDIDPETAKYQDKFQNDLKAARTYLDLLE